MREELAKAAVLGTVVGVFLFAGLGMFAGKVFGDHRRMEEQLKESHQSLRVELQLIQIKQHETNARVIEMRRMK